MIDKLKAFLFQGDAGSAEAHSDAEATQTAAAVLLAEAALMDGHLGDDERDSITTLIGRRFGITAADARALVERAVGEAKQSAELYGYARTLKDRFSYEERIELMEMLWEVVYADGDLHDYEANLMRRLAGLLYVEDQDSGAARKRAMERLGLS